MEKDWEMGKTGRGCCCSLPWGRGKRQHRLPWCIGTCEGGNAAMEGGGGDEGRVVLEGGGWFAWRCARVY